MIPSRISVFLHFGEDRIVEVVGAEVDGAEPPLAVVAPGHQRGPARVEVEDVAVVGPRSARPLCRARAPRLVGRELGQAIGPSFISIFFMYAWVRTSPEYFDTSARLLITSCVMLVASTFSRQVRAASRRQYWPVLIAVTISFSIARSARIS